MINQQIRLLQSDLVMRIREHFFPGIANEQQELIENIPRKRSDLLGTVLITGAASGIGKDCVLNALRAGYRVVALDLADTNLAEEFKTNHVTSYQVDLTRQELFLEILKKCGVMDTASPVYLISAAGVYSDTDFEKCRLVNFEACSSVLTSAASNIPSLVGASIVASDQSYFDKNSQHKYGTPYMNSKQQLRSWYESNLQVLPQRLAFIAPATVITSLTAAVFKPQDFNQNSDLAALLELWKVEHDSIPEGLLNPHHLADVIFKAATFRGVTAGLMDAVSRRRGILLDGKLCMKQKIKEVSANYDRFSLIDSSRMPVTELMNFE